MLLLPQFPNFVPFHTISPVDGSGQQKVQHTDIPQSRDVSPPLRAESGVEQHSLNTRDNTRQRDDKELQHAKDFLDGLNEEQLRALVFKLGLSLSSHPAISKGDDSEFQILIKMFHQLNETIESCASHLAQAYGATY